MCSDRRSHVKQAQPGRMGSQKVARRMRKTDGNAIGPGIRRNLDRFGGVEVNTAGDGFFVVFEGPARDSVSATPRHGPNVTTSESPALMSSPRSPDWRTYRVRVVPMACPVTNALRYGSGA